MSDLTAHAAADAAVATSAAPCSILVADSYADEGLAILADGGANRVVYEPSIAHDDLLRRAAEFDAIIVRSRSRVGRDVVEAAGGRLAVVGRAGVGLDNVDLEAATEAGVLVMNAPGGNTISTAEHSFAMLMALARRIPEADASMKAGVWDKKSFSGVELRGKTLGVLGFGRIGREVAARARAFGMRVVAHDPFVPAGALEELGAESATVEELVRSADFITVHVALTDKTKGMIDAKMLALAKPSLRIVNCARGGVVDEKALVEALNSGRVAGAALDVFEKEPLPADHALRKAKNAVLTPHVAASTSEATRQVAVELSWQVVEALRDGSIRNAANAYNVDASLLERMRPFMELAKRLGSLLAQLSEAPARSLRLSARGAAADFPSLAPLSTSFAIGFLQHFSTRRVNAVNAKGILADRGIALFEHASREGGRLGFDNLLEATVESDDPKKSETLKATSLGPAMGRLVEVDGKRVDSMPDGHILVLENEDVPGIVGAVATALGRHQVNIAQMTWGRRAEGSRVAMTVINCDQEIPDEALAEIRGIHGVTRARHVKA